MTTSAVPSISELAKMASEATMRIHRFLSPTPCKQMVSTDIESGVNLYVKQEQLQMTGSFKVRGSLNKLMLLGQAYCDGRTLTASTGNHALGYGHALKMLDATGTVFLPVNASGYKVERLQSYPVEVKRYGENCLECEYHAKKRAAALKKVWISPYNDVDIIAGQGSIGVELWDQMPAPDTVLMCVGGGGLISGVGAVLKARGCRIIGCQPAVAADMTKSIEAGHIIDPIDAETLSDGSAGGVEKGSITFPLCQQVVDRFILVEESTIEKAVRWAWNRHGLRIEGAAAVALGAFLSNQDSFRGQTVCVVLCGGNIDGRLFSEIVA